MSIQSLWGIMTRPEFVHEAISIDEIGLHTGHYGQCLLKSSYQPIFLVDGNCLVPFAVEGLIKVFRNETCVAPHEFFPKIPDEDRLFIESMCRALHLRNFQHVATPDLDLFFNLNPTAITDLARSLNEIKYMMRRLPHLDICPTKLVYEITEAGAIDTGALRAMVKEFRRNGIRIAIDDYGTEHSNMERVETLSPDIVKIDGSWFRRLAALPAARNLLKSMVTSLRDRDIRVLVEGVETPSQLEAAIQSGADHVQGFLLAKPQLAGTDFRTGSLNIPALVRPADNVIQMIR